MVKWYRKGHFFVDTDTLLNKRYLGINVNRCKKKYSIFAQLKNSEICYNTVPVRWHSLLPQIQFKFY